MRSALRRSVAAGQLSSVARVLWIVWAIIVWNVVLDHVIVVAGRAYIDAASRAVSAQIGPPHYENMDDWMRPAVARGVTIATGSALAILGGGMWLIARASRRQVTACA